MSDVPAKIMVFANLTYYQAPTNTSDTEQLTSDNSLFADRSSLVALIVDTVKSWLADMQVTIENGLVTLKNLAAEKITATVLDVIKLKVGTADQPAGITVYDKNTKQPYCVVVTDGQLRNIAGECESSADQSSEQAADQSAEQTIEESATQSEEQVQDTQVGDEESDGQTTEQPNGTQSSAPDSDSATTTPESL